MSITSGGPAMARGQRRRKCLRGDRPHNQDDEESQAQKTISAPRQKNLRHFTTNFSLFLLLIIVATQVNYFSIYQVIQCQQLISESSYHFHESSFVLGGSSPAGRLQDAGDDLLPAAAAASSSVAATSSSSTGEADAQPEVELQAYDYHANMPVITKRELANAIKLATSQVEARVEPEVAYGDQEESPFPEVIISSMLHKSAPREDSFVRNQTRAALISEEATRQLARQYKLTRTQLTRGLPLISVDSTALGKQCPRQARQFACLPGRYRSFSGHCNNVQQPDWGSAQTPLVRYAPARYLDHVSLPVASLPSARAVSLAVEAGAAAQLDASSSSGAASSAPASRATTGASSAQSSQTNSHMTTMLSFFGQFLFHDLAHVPQSSSSLKCCQSKSSALECMPIELKDSFCLDYVRSTPAARQGCNLGPRDQLNLVSSYLDGSVIYGSSEAQVRQLRAFTGGRLRSQRMRTQSGSPALELLPPLDANSSSSAARDCSAMARMRGREAANCFQAGDMRANQNIGLTLMHTIWMREHNWVADQLAALNRHWRDERLFEEARRIVVAELQHVTYGEFLPSILSDEVMARFNLTIASQGYSQNYDPQLNAGTSNELASAVFPFILSTLPQALERYSERLEMLGTTSLGDTFMDASDLLGRNKFAQYLTGMMSQNAMEPALGLMPSMQMLRNNSTQETGSAQLDLVALIVQQGRDHGLRPYLYWRRVCQLRPQVRTWTDLEQVMPAATVGELRRVYASPADLDLYLALLEFPAPGASLGPTLVCLMARQFYQLKHGDRYWFENDLPQLAFTPRQLDEMRQTSLAKVMCRNSQSSITFIQPSPMLSSDPFLNAYQYCTNKAMGEGLDLTPWRQTVQSAQQVQDEQLMDELMQTGSGPTQFGNSAALRRGKRLIDSSSRLIAQSLELATGQLEQVARQEVAAARAKRPKREATSGGGHAGYRYLPRLKRQALSINNQSVIYELATNEVVRSLVRLGKDREQAQSIQSDIRDFLYSLESIQLDNLLDNSAGSDSIAQFISNANSFFLTDEQRRRLAGDATLFSDPLNEVLTTTTTSTSMSTAPATRSSSISMNCQDEERAFPCDHTSPFRTITGWCNNLLNPKFGASFTLHDRILPNAYEDGLSKPRQLSVKLATSGSGSGSSNLTERLRLPSARAISTLVHDDKSQLHARYSLALMQFGQFGVDHDLTRTPFSVALDGSLLDCSACDSRSSLHRDCLPIEIPRDDAHFHSRQAGSGASQNRKCLHFVRSLNGQSALGPRQQLNALTAYLDGSQIYGSDNCEAKSLRSFQGGRLNASAYPPTSGLGYTPREILPITRLNPECVTPSGLCFHAGDQRASEQPGLTAIHTIFMRLHNSIVDQLAQVNKHWTDERLYQQGRRIVGAIAQRITYGEFVPRLLGLDYVSKFELQLKQVGYSSAYDESCSASILTEFASAAFRMGHSLIRPAFPVLNKSYKPLGKPFQLRTAFFNSHRILSEPQLIDSIMRGVVTTPIETLDNSITEELTNHLFEKPREPFSGMDLISLNIQRARDHGVPAYNRYRVKCNLTKARTFDELAGEIPAKLIKRLATVYAHVDDIDLFTGGMSELPVHGGIIGPTLGCIIGMQFARLKKCDRFWHETSDPFVRFSGAQLAEVRKITLAKVICSQSDTIDTIQRQAMDIPDNYLNPRVACSSLPWLDLSVWRENLKSCLAGSGGQKIKIDLGSSKRVNPCKSCTCTLEGPVCRTVKINCVKMMQKSSQTGSLNAIMADKSCLVQCAWALDMAQQQ